MPEKYTTELNEQKNMSENFNPSDSFPVLNVFKIFNTLSVFFLYVLLGWYENHSAILKVIGTISILVGIASIFTPAKRASIQLFKILSYILYSGLLLSFII